MKYITVKLTEDQATQMIYALKWAKYSDDELNNLAPRQRAFNKFCDRIILKIKDQLNAELS